MDLSGYKNLKQINLYNLALKIKVPKSLEDLSLMHVSTSYCFDLSNCDKIQNLTLNFHSATLNIVGFWSGTDWINEISKYSSLINNIRLTFGGGDFGQNNLEIGKICNKTKRLEMEGIKNTFIIDLVCADGVFLIEELYIKGNNFQLRNSDSISKFVNLKSVIINGSSLSGTKMFSKLFELTYLNLSNNSIEDSSNYKDEEGNIVKYNNLEGLAKLHPNNGGKLKYLYLDGNPGIINFEPVSSLKWDGKSGF